MARHVIPYPAHPRFRADQGFIQIDLQESSEDKRGHRRHRSPFPHPTCTRRLSTIPSPLGRPRGESCHRAALGRGRIGEDPAHSGVESCRRIRSSPRGPMDSIALDSQTGGDGSSWPTSIRKDPPATVSTRKSSWYSSSPSRGGGAALHRTTSGSRSSRHAKSLACWDLNCAAIAFDSRHGCVDR